MLAAVSSRIVFMIVSLMGLILFGSVGYMLLEGWDFADGFFMTVITLSTVGYGETNELTSTGRWFTSMLIVMCFIGMTAWTATLTSFFVDADLGGHLLLRRMEKMISKLHGHTIVCGTTPLAQVVIEKLARARQHVVVVDDNKEELELIRRRFGKVMTVEGSPTDELSLAKANVIQAKFVVAALPVDLDNLLISITCNDLRSDIVVLAESDNWTIANRMRKAGVEEVISPSEICGTKITSMITATESNEVMNEANAALC